MNENLKSPSLEIIERDLTLRLILRGQWDYELPKELISRLFLACKRDGVRVSVSLLGVSSLDYSAATLLLELSMAVKRRGGEWAWEEVPPAIAPILGIVKESKRDLPDPPPPSLSSLLRLGEKIKESLKGLGRFASFLGETLFAMGRSLKESRLIRLKATLYHIEESGIKAVPIIALTSFLVGIVMAYQGAIQLEKFGASIIVVEMTGMLTLRELGPVIAAIVVAGRSASSYAAQIGVMKITEEIDAMKTMNFNPYAFLVIPRVIALVVVMPLVIFLSNVAGLLGEMLIIKSYLGIGYLQYIERFYEMVEIRHLWVGLIKAPFYGAIIALIGCFRGFQITGSTESVGRYTTISVVNAIFWVIALNAMFSIIFTEYRL